MSYSFNSFFNDIVTKDQYKYLYFLMPEKIKDAVSTDDPNIFVGKNKKFGWFLFDITGLLLWKEKKLCHKNKYRYDELFLDQDSDNDHISKTK
jgi:hypothetical protein